VSAPTLLRRVASALLAVLTMSLVGAGCGGTELPTRQEFVDRLEAQSDGLVTEDVASCIYDRLVDDDAAAEALRDSEEDGPLPPELEELVVSCMGAEPRTGPVPPGAGS